MLASPFHNLLSAPESLWRDSNHYQNFSGMTRWSFSEPLRTVSWLEVLQAACTLAGTKARGPDVFPVEISQSPPTLLELAGQLSMIILDADRFPKRMLQLQIIPFDKSNKPNPSCSSTHPDPRSCCI